MWRRICARLQTVSPWSRSVLIQNNNVIIRPNQRLINSASSSSSTTISPFHTTPPLFSEYATSRFDTIFLKGKKTVEDRTEFSFPTESCHNNDASSLSLLYRSLGTGLSKWGAVGPAFSTRSISTVGHAEEPISASVTDIAPRIKFKRLDKTAKHIMQILDKEAVQGVREQREILDIKPGYIVQLKVEVPENKRRVSILKGIVIARRNAGLNSTFRIRRLVAGVGVESVFPLYSPNIKEMKVLDKKKVRRAKLYYLRDKMNALKKH
ncbi:Ribosomal protein L19 [Macleaya cordata]|uniref:Ribosomal protein L19 n=1 Tax=Macleaya cordata TaxID=56857 RepID=A0A200PQI5_MACCD|nr:Ribosomal protein L19 [Macleaya cordata]